MPIFSSHIWSQWCFLTFLQFLQFLTCVLPSHPTSPRMSLSNFVTSLFPAAFQHTLKKKICSQLFISLSTYYPPTFSLATAIKLLKESCLYSPFPFPLQSNYFANYYKTCTPTLLTVLGILEELKKKLLNDWMNLTVNMETCPFYLTCHSVGRQVFRWYFLKSSGICHLLSTLTAITLVLVPTTSIPHFDYCWRSLTGLPWLHMSQNTASRVDFHETTSLLKCATSWIPIDPRITFNLLIMVYISWHCTAPWSESKLKTHWIVISKTGHCLSCL